MIVLDATVAIKLLTREPGADQALARVIGEEERAAPDWIRLEVANALARKVRLNGLSEAAAAAGRASLPVIVTREISSHDLVDDAFALALRLEHPAYDCLYLALAERLDTTLLTHDRKFAAAAQRAGYGTRVELLGN